MGMKAADTANMEGLLAHAGWLRRFAHALLRDAAEGDDLAQDTLLRAARHPRDESGRAWLASVARNLATDRFRAQTRRARREEVAGQVEAGRVASPEELVGNAEIHRQVAEAVKIGRAHV